MPLVRPLRGTAIDGPVRAFVANGHSGNRLEGLVMVQTSSWA